jgi:hypothetical protein
MSDWVHFTGGFGLDGLIFEEAQWGKIGDEINQLISPLPYSSDYYESEGGHEIKLYDQSSLHFADVFVSDDVRYADSLDEIEQWLLKISERMKEKDWRIRCGCFFAYVEYSPPVIYYCDGDEYEPCAWRKIMNVNGEILQNEAEKNEPSA